MPPNQDLAAKKGQGDPRHAAAAAGADQPRVRRDRAPAEEGGRAAPRRDQNARRRPAPRRGSSAGILLRRDAPQKHRQGAFAGNATPSRAYAATPADCSRKQLERKAASAAGSVGHARSASARTLQPSRAASSSAISLACSRAGGRRAARSPPSRRAACRSSHAARARSHPRPARRRSRQGAPRPDRWTGHGDRGLDRDRRFLRRATGWRCELRARRVAARRPSASRAATRRSPTCAGRVRWRSGRRQLVGEQAEAVRRCPRPARRRARDSRRCRRGRQRAERDVEPYALAVEHREVVAVIAGLLAQHADRLVHAVPCAYCSARYRSLPPRSQSTPTP